MKNESEIFNATKILNDVLNGEKKSHEELIQYIKENIAVMKKFRGLTDSDIEAISFAYEKLYGGQTFKPGTIIKSKDASDIWFYNKKKEMKAENHAFESRYKRFLSVEHFSESAIDNIFANAEKVLSLCSDPESNEKRRGLVMGDVQSGKTASYLALSSLAYDYGYNCILILAGITDSLRIQTQERVDEGVVGAESSKIGDANTVKYIGVGLFDSNDYYAEPLTTDKQDFSSIPATSTSFRKPLILVVKKNKAVLSSVKKWLKPGQARVSSRNILIIDDECDNASVNTKNDDDPSTINGLIRDIYNNFNCSTYVGYTATPFANVFINPDKRDGYDDLFPNEFIYRLHASPESYFGADKVFKETTHLVLIDENEPNFLPAKHKKNDDFPGLTESLRNAICNFLICNCIRTARGDGTQHRSMMINITPYNCIQEDIKDCVEAYLDKLINSISNCDKRSLERFILDPEMHRIYDIYNKDPFYSKTHGKEEEPLNVEVPFSEIKDLLFDEVAKFKVAVINNKYKGDQRFDYDDYKETGARVIAIGGFVLSRGLTLKGLMTSYFSRNSSAYDTLLQMCRWFGYRPNYEDLCRVYMSQINVDNFGAIIDAVEELDQQLEVMNVQGKSPADFGLMIRESPDTLETKLLITARNKMKNSSEVIRPLNYSGRAIDTSKLFKSTSDNDYNILQVEKFISRLKESGKSLGKYGASLRLMYKDVDPELLAELIRNLRIPLENKKFDKENIADFISKQEYYKKWDVVFATGDTELSSIKYNLPTGETITPISRRFDMREEEDFIRISGTHNRLVEPGIFNAGLSEDEIRTAQENAKKNHPNSKDPNRIPNLIATDYLDVPGRNPVFVILPIHLLVNDKALNKDGLTRISNLFIMRPLLGFALGFAGREGGAVMAYRMNKVKENEYQRKSSIDDDQDEEEEMEDGQSI